MAFRAEGRALDEILVQKETEVLDGPSMRELHDPLRSFGGAISPCHLVDRLWARQRN